MQDHEIIERIKPSDAYAFKEFFERYNGLVINLCYKLVSNKEEAEDLTQEVFFKAYKSVKTFKHRSKISTWIYRIAVNLCLNHLKKERRYRWFSLDSSSKQDTAEILNTMSAPTGDQPEVLLEQKERGKIVWKVINSLPQNQRLALILQRYEGLSCQQIAEILDCSLSSVQSRLHRAKQNLHEKLLPYLENI